MIAVSWRGPGDAAAGYDVAGTHPGPGVVAGRPARDAGVADHRGRRDHRGRARHRASTPAPRPGRLGDHRARLHRLGPDREPGPSGASRGRRSPGSSPGTGTAPAARRASSASRRRRRSSPSGSRWNSTTRWPPTRPSPGGCPRPSPEGIRYAADHGARVIDLPLDPGTPGLTGQGDPAAAGGSPAERAAVAYALSKNVVLVAPAGDDGQGPGLVNYPAAYPGVIAVGAVGRDGQLAPFSSRRSHASLTAPGVGLVAATPPDGYARISSTSTASGIVAGVAALVLSRFPHLTAAQVDRGADRGHASPASSLRPGRSPRAPGTAPSTRPGRSTWPPPSAPRAEPARPARSGPRRPGPSGCRPRRLTGPAPAPWPGPCCGMSWPGCAC